MFKWFRSSIGVVLMMGAGLYFGAPHNPSGDASNEEADHDCSTEVQQSDLCQSPQLSPEGEKKSPSLPATYRLPFKDGRTYAVTQGYLGTRSHKNHYAIDWKMPVGTPILASRAGQVLRVKENSRIGGPFRKYIKNANYISIKHEDGTIGFYCHLKYQGVTAREGEWVGAGDLIGYSGNTGYSTGPHLHFSVLKIEDGVDVGDVHQVKSIPVTFLTRQGAFDELKVGKRYTSVHHPRFDSGRALAER